MHRVRWRQPGLWLGPLVGLVLGGCATLGMSHGTPRVSVSDIRVLETTLLEQLYEVTLRIQNPDDRPLAIQGGSFDLEINGRDFGHGVSDSRVTVPAFGDAKIQVRMVSTLFGMLRLVQSFEERQGERLAYGISGRLQVDRFPGAVGFSEEGDLSLPGDLSGRNAAEPSGT